MISTRGAAATLAVGGGVAAAIALSQRGQQRTRQDSRTLSLRPALPALPAARDGAENWPGALPLVTPVEDFYVTDVNPRPTLVDHRTWRLAVDGDVERPLSLSLDDLMGWGLEEFDATPVCIHNRLGWDRLGNQRGWAFRSARSWLRQAGADRAGTSTSRPDSTRSGCAAPRATARSNPRTPPLPFQEA